MLEVDMAASEEATSSFTALRANTGVKLKTKNCLVCCKVILLLTEKTAHT